MLTPSLQSSRKPYSTKVLLGMKDLLKFDLAVQRNFVWGNDPERMSLLIHSILQGYPVPALYAQVVEGDKKSLYFLDGRQRLTTVMTFMKNEWALENSTPPIELEDGTFFEIKNLKFEALPEEFRDIITTFQFDVHKFDSITTEQRDELFYRINNGMALTKMEIIRVLASSGVMTFVNEIADMQFFAENINLTENYRRRFVDEELILQIVALAKNNFEAVEFSSKAIQAFALSLKKDGITDDIKKVITETTEYLNKAFVAKVQEKFLKKVHVPILFAMAVKAQKMDIEPRKFSGWATTFLSDEKGRGGTYKAGSKYGEACSHGSAKKDKVALRLKEMGEHFSANVTSAPEYIQPKPKEAKGGKKNNKQEFANVQGLVVETQTGNIVVMETPAPAVTPAPIEIVAEQLDGSDGVVVEDVAVVDENIIAEVETEAEAVQAEVAVG